MARQIRVEIVGDEKDALRAFKAVDSGVRRLNVSFGTIAKSALGFAAVTASVDLLGKAIHAGVAEFSDQQKVAAQTTAVIKSTGAAAGVSAKQIDTLAASISAYSGIDDEAVQASENLLLTFTNIRNTVGKGNDVFNQATRAVTDLSVAMGIKGTNAALQVGKALNDPLRGYARLQRIGVAFTKSQVDQIKGFAKVGETMKAQKVVLAELVKEFGGSAKALGDTVPGQLNKLRETFRNIAGDLVGRLAPAFVTALTAANDFVQKLAKASGLHAKFDVVIDGLKDLGSRVVALLREQLARIDVGEVVGELQTRLASALQQIGQFLGQVDFSAVGRAIGDGLVRGVQGAAQFLQSVDWAIVGSAIVNGIRDFLVGVNWKAVAVTTVRLIVASFKANVALLRGAGQALGSAVIDGIVAGLRELGREAEKLSTRVALKILEPFTHLPSLLGDKARQAKEALQAQLAEMEASATHTAGVINGVFGVTPLEPNKPSRAGGTGAAKPKPVKVPVVPVVDTKPIVSAADKAKTAFEKMLAGLQLGADRAELTKRLSDDIAANNKILAALRSRAAVAKGDLDVQRQIVAALARQKDLQQQQAQIAKEARQARQFRALGLTGDGGETIPGVPNLRKQLASLTSRIAGSTVNLSSRLKSQLAGVRKILSGEFGKVTAETRQKIQELYQTIRSELNKGAQTGPLTKTTQLNIERVLDGLGLGREAKRLVRARLSHFNSAGTALAGTGSGSSTVTHTTNVVVDGKVVATASAKYNSRTQKLNPSGRNGPNAGRYVGA